MTRPVTLSLRTGPPTSAPLTLGRARVRAFVRIAEAAPVVVLVAGAALAATSALSVTVRVVGALLVALGVIVAIGDLVYGSTRRLARALGGRLADSDREARLVNLAEGLCLGFGVAAPRILVLDDTAPNALTLGRSARSATLFVTVGALELLDRMQLEAVLAHELAHMKRGDTAASAVALRAFGFASLLGAWGAGLAEHGVATDREALADLAAMSVTRYPPALADALEALAGAPSVRPRSLPPSVARLTAWQWCAPFARHPSGRCRPGELDLSLRIAALREL